MQPSRAQPRADPEGAKNREEPTRSPPEKSKAPTAEKGKEPSERGENRRQIPRRARLSAKGRTAEKAGKLARDDERLRGYRYREVRGSPHKRGLKQHESAASVQSSDREQQFAHA